MKHIIYISLSILYLLLFGNACRANTETASTFIITPIYPIFTATPAIPKATITPIRTSPSLTLTPSHTETTLITTTSTQTPKPSLLPTALPTDIPNEIKPISYTLPFGIQDSTGFVIQDEQLTIIDLTLPTNPGIIWQSEKLGENVKGLGIVKQRAYVHSDTELLIWDVYESQQPNLMVTLPISGYVYLDEEEPVIYLLSLANNIGEITTIDIANPASPQVLGTATIPWSIPLYYPFKITQKHVFLIHNGLIEIFDISNPDSNHLIGIITANTTLNSNLEVAGNYLFVNTTTELLIIDFANTDRVLQIGQYKNIQIDGMSIVDNTAYLFWQICEGHVKDDGKIARSCGYGLDAVNIMNPTQLISIDLYELYSQDLRDFHNIFIQGNLMYFMAYKDSEGEQQLFVLNLPTLQEQH